MYPKIIKIEALEEKFIFFLETGYVYRVWEAEKDYCVCCCRHYLPGDTEDQRDISCTEMEMHLCEAIAFHLFKFRGHKPKEFYLENMDLIYENI